MMAPTQDRSPSVKIRQNNGRAKKARAIHGNTEPVGSLEASIVEMARSGELAKAAEGAIALARKQGLPITFQGGTKIIKQYADGREEVLEVIRPVAYKLPKGVKIFAAGGTGKR
jgi:hypothetical protein